MKPAVSLVNLTPSSTGFGSLCEGWAGVAVLGHPVHGQAGADDTRQLTWFDRGGRVLGTTGDPAPYVGVALVANAAGNYGRPFRAWIS